MSAVTAAATRTRGGLARRAVAVAAWSRANPVTALAEISENPRQFHLLITGLKTRLFDGRRLIADARAANFEGKIIVFSGCFTLNNRSDF